MAFELAGFQNIKREGVRVVINQTLTVDQQLNVATLQETVTVTGASPVVDTSTTQVGTNFTKELLTEIPNARDIWAAMAQAPGIQMTSYDVGGSRTGTQTGFLTYGYGQQNQTKLEGIDTTEGTGANAGYFDFGSFEEFQVGGAGSGADSFGGGTNMSITVKSGGDRFTGSWYSDWEGDATISDNVPDAFKVANQKDEDGYFSSRALTRGNPIDRQYDINANIGGPLWKQKAWFFYSYRLNDQYKYTLGIDELARSKLSNKYTLKGTFQLNRNNQVIAFLNKREKLQELRDLGPLVPISAARYQSSRNYPWKFEWTSVLGGKAFLDVLAGNWYNFFPLEPTDQYGFTSDVGPGPHRHLQQPAHRVPRLVSGPEALQAAGLRRAVVLQGRLGRLARLQGRLRLEARSPLLHAPAAGWRHLLPRPERQRERTGALQLAEHLHQQRRLQRRRTSATAGRSTSGSR